MSSSTHRTLKIDEKQDNFESKAKNEWDAVARALSDFNGEHIFRRINAERNIVPEVENKQISVTANGDGTTNIIRMFINHSDYDEDAVQQTLLKELNKIMKHMHMDG